MSFYYVNPGLLGLFNYFTEKHNVDQISSNIHNPNCGVACMSTSAFGYYFNEVISSISGSFYLYVTTNNPLKDIFTIGFYNLDNISSSLNTPIFLICGYPDGTVLNDDYFPLRFKVGRNVVYTTNDTEQCSKIAYLNKIWFRLVVESSKVATLELCVNNNAIYSYKFDFNVDNIGNALIFTLNDSSISNILLSSSYTGVAYYEDVVNIPFAVSSSSMMESSNSYIVDSSMQKLTLKVSENEYGNHINNIYCSVLIKDNQSNDLSRVVANISNVHGNTSVSSYKEFDVSDVVTIPINDSGVTGDYVIAINFDSLSSMSTGE